MATKFTSPESKEEEVAYFKLKKNFFFLCHLGNDDGGILLWRGCS